MAPSTERLHADMTALEACVGGETRDPRQSAVGVPSAAHASAQHAKRGVWERDEAYPSIVQDGDLRVIECKDALQWILQRRRKGGAWTDLGYHRDRDVLIERCGPMSPGALAVLRALPPYHLVAHRRLKRSCPMPRKGRPMRKPPDNQKARAGVPGLDGSGSAQVIENRQSLPTSELPTAQAPNNPPGKKWQAMKALARMNLNGAEYAVLVCLIDHANENTGLCYPSESRIAAWTNRPERTVKRAIASLKQRRLYRIVRRAGTSNRYYLNWPKLLVCLSLTLSRRRNASRLRGNESISSLVAHAC
jgi:hypothetical protein